MDSSQAILLMIGICVAFIALTAFAAPVKVAVKVFFRGAMGLLAVYILNILFLPIGVSVGLNFITWLLTGLLGVPGLVLLYAVSCTINL